MYDINGNEISDEERSYHEWFKNNLHYMQQNKNHISVMKKLYMEGYAAGFAAKQKKLAEEYLQK